MAADGDCTVRSSLMDVVRGYDWPSQYTARVLKRRFLDRPEAELANATAVELPKWNEAWEKGEVEDTSVFISESVGLIRSATCELLHHAWKRIPPACVATLG